MFTNVNTPVSILFKGKFVSFIWFLFGFQFRLFIKIAAD